MTAKNINSPIGILGLIAEDDHLVEVLFEGLPKGMEESDSKVLQETEKQLNEYFAGERTTFELPLQLDGTEFQLAVWAELQQIPYGETASYGEIANRIGNPKAVRAVGGANNKNRIPIIIPCHRVIGKNGSMVGFGGGLETKTFLLELEHAHDANHQ